MNPFKRLVFAITLAAPCIAQTQVQVDIEKLMGAWTTGGNFEFVIGKRTIYYEFDMKEHPYRIEGDILMIDFEDPSLGVQRMNANTIDKSLPKQPVGEWVRKAVGPKVALRWEVNDCGEATGTISDLGRELPACVQVEGDLSPEVGFTIMVSVENRKHGYAGPVRLWHCSIRRGKDPRSWIRPPLGQLGPMLRQAVSEAPKISNR